MHEFLKRINTELMARLAYGIEVGSFSARQMYFPCVEMVVLMFLLSVPAVDLQSPCVAVTFGDCRELFVAVSNCTSTSRTAAASGNWAKSEADYMC